MWLLKEPFFVCTVCYSLSVNGNFKETFYLACFCFYLHFEHFHTAAFFSSEIFSYLMWYHSPQIEQNAMKNPLSSIGSSSKNGTRHLQYNGKRCVTSIPRLTRFVCYCYYYLYFKLVQNSKILIKTNHPVDTTIVSMPLSTQKKM